MFNGQWEETKAPKRNVLVRREATQLRKRTGHTRTLYHGEVDGCRPYPVIPVIPICIPNPISHSPRSANRVDPASHPARELGSLCPGASNPQRHYSQVPWRLCPWAYSVHFSSPALLAAGDPARATALAGVYQRQGPARSGRCAAIAMGFPGS